MNVNLYNIARLLIRIVKEKPIITIVTFTVPLISGLLSFYAFAAQSNLINIMVNTNHIRTDQIIRLSVIPILFFVCIYAVQALCNRIAIVLKSHLNGHLTFSFHAEIARVASILDYEKFEDRAFGDTLDRAKKVVGEDLDGITGFLVSTVHIAAGLISVVWLSATNGYMLATVIVLLLIVSSLMIRVATELKVRRVGKEITYDGRMSDYLAASLQESHILRELKVYHAFDFFRRVWADYAIMQYNKRYGARKFEIKMGMLVSIIQTTGIFITLLYLLNKMNVSDNVSIGGISVLFLALLSVGGQIMALSWPVSKLYITSYKLHDLNEVLKWGKLLREDQDNDQSKEMAGRIDGSITAVTLTNVSFKYANSNSFSIQNLNMTIRQGEKIAIVGANGAGKSTLIKLILQHYKPTSGNIHWNGVDWLDGKISIVFQDFIRFELTLRENIALDNANSPQDDQKIIQTLKQCDLLDLYEELGSLDVVLGQMIEGGRQLSGGQWQKLAIARALYNQADFIICDEMTAAIDPISEVEIYNKLLHVCKDKTAIFISHRLGWTKHADCIYVMEAGEIIEYGTHNELLSKASVYANMYNQQASWYK